MILFVEKIMDASYRQTISEGTHKKTIKKSYLWRMILQIFLLYAYNLCPDLPLEKQ